MLRRAFILIPVVPLLVLVAGCEKVTGGSGGRYVLFTQVSHKEAVPAGAGRLEVELLSGAIKVVGEDAGALRIEADVKVKEAVAGQLAEKGDFADHVKLEIRNGVVHVSDAHAGSSSASDWQLHLVIHVPRGLTVATDVGAGKVEIEDTEGDLEIDTGAGDVVVTSKSLGAVAADVSTGELNFTTGKVGGAVKIEVGTGNLTLRVTDAAPSGNVTLECGTGNLTLDLPSDPPGRFNMQVRTGNLNASFGGTGGLRKSGLILKADVVRGSGAPVYDLTVGTGNLTVN